MSHRLYYFSIEINYALLCVHRSLEGLLQSLRSVESDAVELLHVVEATNTSLRNFFHVGVQSSMLAILADTFDDP